MSTEINIKVTQLFKCMLIIIVTLCLLHVIAMVVWYEDYAPDLAWYYFSMFDLDEESGLGTWYSALNLFFAGQLTLLAVKFNWYTTDKMKLGWIFLAIGFHILSIDEVAGFHELLNTVVTIYHWTIFGAVLVAFLFLLLLPFLKELPVRTLILFLISGAVYVGGAVGVELFTVIYEDNDELNTLEYNLWNTLEEGMEMSGVVLYIYALLDGLVRHCKDEPPLLTVKISQ